MQRYFFDTRDDDVLIEDEEGLELPSFATAKQQAARYLAELAIDILPAVDQRTLAVDVRNEGGELLLSTVLTFEARLKVHE